MSVDWTPELIEQVRADLSQGNGPTAIAKKIPGATTSAVAGLVHRRLDLPRPAPKRQRRVPTGPRTVPVDARPSIQRIESRLRRQKPVETVPESLVAGLLALRSNQCRWPGEDNKFCEARRASGKGAHYCESHRRASLSPGGRRLMGEALHLTGTERVDWHSRRQP